MAERLVFHLLNSFMLVEGHWFRVQNSLNDCKQWCLMPRTQNHVTGEICDTKCLFERCELAAANLFEAIMTRQQGMLSWLHWCWLHWYYAGHLFSQCYWKWNILRVAVSFSSDFKCLHHNIPGFIAKIDGAVGTYLAISSCNIFKRPRSLNSFCYLVHLRLKQFAEWKTCC